MKVLKTTYLKDPCMGSRRLVTLLKRDYDETVNRKRLQRMRREMGMKTIYCRPRTTIPNKEHKKYPYLLRNLAITCPATIRITPRRQLKLPTLWLVRLMFFSG